MYVKISTIIINTIIVMILLFGLLISLTLLPITGNIKILTVLSGSMEPSIHTGSMIFIRPASEYEVGDVVTRNTDEKDVTITHRIIQKELVGNETVFHTKGDANNVSDSDVITQDMIIGKVFWTMPYIGFPVNFAKTTQGVLLIFVIPAVIIVYEEIGKIRKEIVRMTQERKRKNTEVQIKECNVMNDPERAQTHAYEHVYTRNVYMHPEPRTTSVRRKIV